MLWFNPSQKLSTTQSTGRAWETDKSLTLNKHYLETTKTVSAMLVINVIHQCYVAAARKKIVPAELGQAVTKLL